MPGKLTRISTPTIAFIAACLLLPASASAMRCGTALITKGDIQAKVIKHCGEPAQTTQRYGLRKGFYPQTGTRINSARSSFSTGTQYRHVGQYEVLVEDWIFNLGPNRFMRQITFENGIVVRVKTLGYGYHETPEE